MDHSYKKHLYIVFLQYFSRPLGASESLSKTNEVPIIILGISDKWDIGPLAFR